MSTKESVEQYLARGGVIKKCLPGPLPDETLTPRTNPTPTGSATIMSLADGALYYAEGKVRKERKKKVEKAINFSALPASLRKFVPQQDED